MQDAVMRAIMQTAKQNVEVLKTLKIRIGMELTDEVTEDKTLNIQIADQDKLIFAFHRVNVIRNGHQTGITIRKKFQIVRPTAIYLSKPML